MIFINSASSPATLVFYLTGVCTHTDTKGKQRKARVWNILKSSEKIQYLMNTLYLNVYYYFFAKFSAYCRTPRICRPCEFTFENLWARSPLTLSACATCPLTLKVWEGRELEAPLNPPDQCRKTLRFGANESCTLHSVCRWVLLFTFLSLSRFTSVPAPFSLLCLLHNNKFPPLKG